MLSRLAVNKFRDRQLDSYRWMKRLTLRELKRMVADLDVQHEFISKKKMWKHQYVAFLIGVYIEYFLFFLDMGLGKSRVILELIAYFKKRGDLKAALILVPNTASIESWVMQVEEHRPDLDCVPMYGSSEERWELMNDGWGEVFIINYAGLRHMCCELVELQYQDKRKLMVNERSIRELKEKFDLICLDESTEIMNHRSLTYRLCKKLARGIRFRFGMAGIPLGRDPQALWSQFNFCDDGETLGTTLSIFREAFFKRTENYWSGGYDYKFNRKYTKRLNRVIQNRSIHYDESECRDVPKKMYNPIYVPFTPEMRAYYNRIVAKLKADKRDLRLARNTFLNLRQLASGFIGVIDDESGTKAHIEFPENPKMEALAQLVREIPTRRKFLIYHQFVWTGERIGKELEKLGIKYVWIRGAQKDGPAMLRQFTEDEETKAMVLSNDCGAFALNLQRANYEFFVESPVSPIIRGQAEKRLRPGLQPMVTVNGRKQRRRCFYMDFIMRKNTADESIQTFLKEGKNIESALMRGSANFDLRKV